MRILCPLSTLFRIAFWLVVVAVVVGMALGHHSLPQS